MAQRHLSALTGVPAPNPILHGGVLAQVWVPGAAQGQGSLVGRFAHHPTKVLDYRRMLTDRLAADGAARGLSAAVPHDGAYRLVVAHFVLRPAAHWRTGRNAHLLRESAPVYPVLRGPTDGDKVVRLVNDAVVNAGIVRDDSQMTDLEFTRRWASETDPPGLHVTVATVGWKRS